MAKIEIIGSPTVWRPRLALYIPEAVGGGHGHAHSPTDDRLGQ